MMLQQLKIALLKARKEQDALKVSVLGYLISAIQNKEIALRGKDEEFTDESVKEVIKTQIKQREAAVEEAANAGRADVEEKEKSELEVLKEIASEYSI